MLLFYMVFFVVVAFMYKAEAREVNDLICQEPPDERCLIQGKTLETCAHEERWMFNWDNKTCVKIFWGEHCGPPDTGVNMFTSERRCFNDCHGWS